MRIDTDRLIIRSAEPTDAPSLMQLFNDADVRRFLPPGQPLTLERAERFAERLRAMEQERGYALWIVERRDTQEFIGDAGIQPLAGTDEVELAYHYLPSAWGQGFATEAATSILEYGLSTLELNEIVAIVIPENVASWRVLEKAGMRYVGTASYYGLDGLKKYVAGGAWQRPVPSENRT